MSLLLEHGNNLKSIIDIGEGWTCRGVKSVLASTNMERKV
jgi:hypothetical protein